MVYASSSLSLAAIELFVHLDPEDAPSDLVAIPAAIDGSLHVHKIPIERLPARWRSTPAPEANFEVGASWFAQARSAVLELPSAVIPEEANYLINPAHPGFSRIRVGEPRPFQFDPRMWKS